MADDGYNTMVGKIVARGEPPIVIEKEVETATDVYPGRLLAKGTSDYDVIVNSGILPVVGWAGFEHTNPNYRKEAKSTIYAANDVIAVLRGGGFAIETDLAPGMVALQGDPMIPWGAGCVAPGPIIKGYHAIRMAFTNTATDETDTNVDLPSGIYVVDCFIDVNTAVAAATVKVGMLSTEASGDADGFLVDESAATAGDIVPHNSVDAAAANLTLGALLVESDIKDNSTPLYVSIPIGYVCDGTTVSVSYTTNDKAIAGYIYLLVTSPGTRCVGFAGNSVTTTTATAKIIVETI